ncbi:MAG: thioesterase domain-containing protein, partial [Chloroflexi bacterium]|nr:thioesterase domain-containing protein [Chloroflexota bacterium]
AGLAQGYLNRPELTAEKFIPHPFSPEAGARLYQTGDLARTLPGGDIEFLGRKDAQVKIRGYRIEPGEVEAVLGQHPLVREAVVTVRQGAAGDKYLAAYVVSRPGKQLAENEIRDFLRARLPEYMVPAAFVVLDTLPLTPNGKIDRQALPAPERSNLELAKTAVPARDALELKLVRIWEEVLDVRPVGVNHNFFELGGHSLLAVRLMARIRQELTVELPLTTLFQSPTVQGLAAVLRQGEEMTITSSSLVPLQVGNEKKRPLFFVHPGGGNVFSYSDLVRYLGPEWSFYGFQARGIADPKEAPHTRVETMAGYYLKLLRQVQPEGPYFLGGWSVGGVVAFEMAWQLQKQGHEVGLLALVDSPVPNPHKTPALAYRAPRKSWLKARRGIARPVWFLLSYLLPLVYILGAILSRLAFQSYRLVARLYRLVQMAYYGFVPGKPSAVQRRENALRALAFVQELFALPVDRPIFSWEQLLQLGKDEQLAYILDRAIAANILSSTMRLPYFGRLFQIYEANSQAMRQYVLKPYAGRVLFFRAADPFPGHARLQESASRKAARWALGLGLALAVFLYFDSGSILTALLGLAGMIFYFAVQTPLNLPLVNKVKEFLWPLTGPLQDPTQGWGKVVTGEIEAYPVPGNHFTIIRDANAALVAEGLKEHFATLEGLAGFPPGE